MSREHVGGHLVYCGHNLNIYFERTTQNGHITQLVSNISKKEYWSKCFFTGRVLSDLLVDCTERFKGTLMSYTTLLHKYYWILFDIKATIHYIIIYWPFLFSAKDIYLDRGLVHVFIISSNPKGVCIQRQCYAWIKNKTVFDCLSISILPIKVQREWCYNQSMEGSFYCS